MWLLSLVTVLSLSLSAWTVEASPANHALGSDDGDGDAIDFDVTQLIIDGVARAPGAGDGIRLHLRRGELEWLDGERTMARTPCSLQIKAGGYDIDAEFQGAPLTARVRGDELVIDLANAPHRKEWRCLRVPSPIDTGAVLEQAREARLQRNPKQAIELYGRVIHEDRFDIMHAAPAMVELIQCFQMLKDDPAMASRYDVLMAGWLSHPPPLDGTSAPILDEVEEDLLWKQWPVPDGLDVPPIPTLSIVSIDKNRSMSNGLVREALRFSLEGRNARHQHLHPALEAAEASPQAEAAVAPEGSVIAVTPDGAVHPANRVVPVFGARAVCLQLEFLDPPSGLTLLTTLSGGVRASQDKEWEFKRLPLRENESWRSVRETCRISALSQNGDACRLVVTRSRNPGSLGTLPATATASSMPMSTTADEDSPWWLTTADRARILPHTCSSTTNGAETTTTLEFTVIGRPIELVCRVVTKVSTRMLPFEIHAVDLP